MRKTRPNVAKPSVERGKILDTLTVADAVILGSWSHPDADPGAFSVERDDFEVTSSNLKGDRVLFTIVSHRSDGSIASFRRAAARTPEIAEAVKAHQWQRVAAVFETRFDSATGREWNDIVALTPAE